MKRRGELFVMITPGAAMMPWWSAGCWGTHRCWHFILDMNRALVLYGCPTWPALGVRAVSVNVHTLAGERPLVATLQMLVSSVAVVSTDVVF